MNSAGIQYILKHTHNNNNNNNNNNKQTNIYFHKSNKLVLFTVSLNTSGGYGS